MCPQSVPRSVPLRTRHGGRRLADGSLNPGRLLQAKSGPWDDTKVVAQHLRSAATEGVSWTDEGLEHWRAVLPQLSENRLNAFFGHARPMVWLVWKLTGASFYKCLKRRDK